MRDRSARARTDFMARRFDGRDAAVKVPLAGVSDRHYVRVTLTSGRLVRRVFTQFAEPRTPPARLHISCSRSEGAVGFAFPTAAFVSRVAVEDRGSGRAVSILVPTRQAIALRSP